MTADGKTQPDWDSIRTEYEGRQFVPQTICRRHGITPAQLRYRRERDDWLNINAHPPSKTKLVARMLRVLDGQVKELEEAGSMPIETRAKLLAEQVKTLDKLIELGAAPRNVEPPSKRDMKDIRARLVKRLDQADRE